MRLVQRVCRRANWRIRTCARATISMHLSIHPLAMAIWARKIWVRKTWPRKMGRRARNRPGLRSPGAAATDGNPNPTCLAQRGGQPTAAPGRHGTHVVAAVNPSGPAPARRIWSRRPALQRRREASRAASCGSFVQLRPRALPLNSVSPHASQAPFAPAS
jgi:hypothetical protein